MSAKRALDAWERGQRSLPCNRALDILSTALPEVSSKDLARLPIGRRDALVFKLRDLSLGSKIRGFARCPKCQIGLELQLDSHQFEIEESLQPPPKSFQLTLSPYRLELRLPDSTDFEIMSRCDDTESAMARLLERCILQAQHHDAPCNWQDLPSEIIEAVGQKMEDLDPLADLPLIVDCGRCEHRWQILLDVGEIFWGEISSMAERLLHEVRSLALAYGWSEAEILAISAARRKFYLEHLPSPSE